MRSSAGITIGEMQDSSTVRRSSWRFSLRELLLLMLGVAAFLGWGTLLYQSRRLKPTPFFASHPTWQQQVVEIFQDLGEPAFVEAPGTMTYSEGPSSVQRTMVFKIPLAASQKEAFLRALVAKVREAMKRDGCQNTGESGSTMSNVVSVLDYVRGPVSGSVQICVMEAGIDHLGVVMTMQEERGYRGQHGLENR
jgi:hypothetical protein